MPVKKTTKKKVVKKPRAKKKPVPFMTVDLPKGETPTAVENVKLALDAMVVSPGWQIIRKILDDNIAFLETAILEKVDPKTKISISDEEVEKLRYKRSLNIEVRDTPANYKKHLDNTGIVPKDFDPYFKNSKDIKLAEARERM